MAALHVRNVPESLMMSLRERAERHGRSVQQEVLHILKKAAEEPLNPEVPGPIGLVTVRTDGRASWRRDEIYGDE